jgi:hypothetical protein
MPDLAETINANSRATQPERSRGSVSGASSLAEIPDAADWIEVEGNASDGFMGQSFKGPDAKADAIEWATDTLIELGRIRYTVGSHGTVI